MFNKNNWVTGAIIGLCLPAAIFGVLWIIIFLTGIDNSEFASGVGRYLKNANIMLLAIFINMLPFRYYMVSLKYEKTGRAILVSTIVYTVVFFYFYL